MDLNRQQTREQLNQQIRLEEIRQLYGSTPFSYTASVVITLIIYFILSGHVRNEDRLDIWLFTILGVMLVRSIESYRFLKCNELQQLQNGWRIRFFIGTGVAGFCWGLLPWLAYSTEVEYIAFITVCTVGVIAGSLSTLSYRWEAMALFMLPASLLLVLRLAIDNQSFSEKTSYLLAIFIFFSLSVGRRIFNNTQQNIRLRIEADIRERSIELMHQKQALHLQNTPLAIIEFDIDLNITEWNKAAERIFGYSRKEAINQNIMRLIILREKSDEAEKVWQRLLNYEAVIGAVIENKTKPGTPIYCEWFVTPLTDSNNNIAGMAAMALDITDKKNNELAIIKSKEEAEKANQAKSDFLSSMSHELRTPLNAILGFAQLLAFEKSLNNKQHSYVGEISNAGSMLLKLINQILDLARIEKGHLQLSMERIRLSDIFRECSAMISPLARQNNISLNLETGNKSYVIADYTRLKQVIINLLSNAIKYNKDGGSVMLETSQKENSVVRICIIDTGKGISEDLIQDIFQPFYRLYSVNNIEGTGIGLSICKQLLEMMNGTIGVTSSVSEGSNFWIELPGSLDAEANSEHESEAELASTALNMTSQSKHRILVAEDNVTNQTLILSQLGALGYTADLANNGDEALQKMRKNNYDLILTDCNMPVVNGYELAEMIRKTGNEIPIIAITADAFPESKTKCINAGMNDHITKPVELATLRQTVETYLTQPGH